MSGLIRSPTAKNYFCSLPVFQPFQLLMPPPSSLPATPAGAALLLLLLPDGEAGRAAPVRAAIRALQARLGTAIRVLPIDEVTHPIVMRSFGLPTLPASVLMREGLELWRQPGFPTGELTITTLLALARMG